MGNVEREVIKVIKSKETLVRVTVDKKKRFVVTGLREEQMPRKIVRKRERGIETGQRHCIYSPKKPKNG